MSAAPLAPRPKNPAALDPIATALAERFAAALLPGDAAFAPEALEEAARFVADTAANRRPGEPALGIESASTADGRRITRIAAINDDMPFLVDSICAAIGAHSLVIDRLVHPVLAVRRDAGGTLLELPGGDAAGEKRESMVYLETDRGDARTRRTLAAALEATLADVRAAVADWPGMQAAMAADAEGLSDGEGAALLRWFKEGMLTQLGHVTRLGDGTERGALGVCRASHEPLLAARSYDAAFRWFEGAGAAGRVPLIVKSNRIARVHRHVPLDLFIVPVFEGGKLSALSVHAGVWTSAALAAAPDRVPRLRAQLAELMTRFGFSPNGHAGKALVHALTALPHDLLIGFSDADLVRVATAMMSLIDRPRPRLVLVKAPLERHLFAFAWLPRDLLSTHVRLAIMDLVASAADAPVLDWSLEVEGNTLALIRFVLDIRDGAATPDEAALDARLQAMLRGWPQALETELTDHIEPARAATLAARFAEAFPHDYRNRTPAREAAADVLRLRALGRTDNARADQTRDARLCPGEGGELRLKLYQHEGALALSDAVPVLENFGFRVIEDVPTELAGGELGAIHDFELALPEGLDPAALIARAAEIEAAIAAVLNATAENDPFNRLITATALPAREADWLRAWYRYLRQAGLNFSIPTVVDALANAPAVTKGILALFAARHDPAFAGDRAAAATEAEAAIQSALAGVSAINDDRLLRQYRAVVAAMLRTNAFAPAAAEALAFKLDSALVPGLPKPLPWREVFVYSRRVEGIHLRAGPVARGGLRWSDRRDDFRTEVLGLMKAQRVKNAVIVPTGAKGGFYPKMLPDPARDRDGWLAEGRASYQVFIRSLLSITDNIVGAKVVHPKHVVIRDGEDPYFVVAADKGTATFSDTANAIAAEAHFWLDDAFASGGSKGYDHKAMGITAKGAWLSVQRHFLEHGVDVQADPVRVAGVGDMSGDVFGNGMLLSKSIRLVAAFDHRHVFLDPDPDPAKAWAERSRLFALPRSSWDDYDKSLISKGGGVFPRSLKAIPLSLEVRAMLGLSGETADPETLLRAVLKAEVDLMWFGGIGTYIKAAHENNVAVGDPANDALRIDGSEVRAKVIGEGANLGCTQAGRIEYALAGAGGAGGRGNTDFIDNSAGVDCSDKEVNIKIALAAAKRAGHLDEDGRVELLTAMTGDVAHLVLEDNRLQALALSVAEARGSAGLPGQLRLIETLENTGQLDRKTEGLADSETLTRRAADGRGLTRPELAVLLSSAKLALQDAFEKSALPDDPGLEGELLAAFPPAMAGRFAEEIEGHRLRREIIATRLANRLVNRLGMVLPFELAEEEGAGLGAVGGAFVAAERLLGMDAVWTALETTPMPEAARLALFDRAAVALADHMADLLRNGCTDQAACALAGELTGGIASLNVDLDELLTGEARAQSGGMKAALEASGAPTAEAASVTRLFDLDGAVGLARLSRDSGCEVIALAAAFTALGSALGLDWAQLAAARMSPADPWERLLVNSLARDFQAMRLDFLRRNAVQGCHPTATVIGWLEEHADAVAKLAATIARARGAGAVNAAMLAQIAGQARNVLGR